ncbi:unnamed protein product [Cylicostephanus goldi]|uniref:Uncharacterized protein n=1 Tax=Cylicostephanus goldi TaxID=71465 RepID=A0A3P6UZP8_CYLGO|nr:unnamed protein product [Cylicostephanus goldi]
MSKMSFQATLRQVQQFFAELGRRVNKFGTDVQVSLKKATENIGESAEEKENVMTPAPELQDIKKDQ